MALQKLKQTNSIKLASTPKDDNGGEDFLEQLGQSMMVNGMGGHSAPNVFAQQQNKEAIARQAAVDSAASDRTQRIFQSAISNWEGAGNNTETVTGAEYNALDSRQKSILDAQTQLWNAVQEDTKASAAMTPDQQKAAIENTDYASTVTGLFSEQGGSSKYAPRTVALLSELGLGGDFKDLDEYLSGSAFLTKAQILDSTGEAPAADANYGEQNAFRLGAGATNPNISGVLASGQSLIDALQGSADYSFVQGLPSTTKPDPLASLTDLQNSGLSSLMQGMALSVEPEDLGTFVDTVQKEYGVTPELTEAFLRRELNNWEASGTSFGEGYMTPEEFRIKWKVS
jgi:hypothetical protein